MAQIAFGPPDGVLGSLERGDAAFQRLLAARTQSHMAHAGRLSGGEFQRVALIIVPGAQVDRVAFSAAFGHSHDVGEEAQALLRLGRKHLQMAQVGDVSDGFVLHANLKLYRAFFYSK
jgi:hypothetical protein